MTIPSEPVVLQLTNAEYEAISSLPVSTYPVTFDDDIALVTLTWNQLSTLHTVLDNTVDDDDTIDDLYQSVYEKIGEIIFDFSEEEE